MARRTAISSVVRTPWATRAKRRGAGRLAGQRGVAAGNQKNGVRIRHAVQAAVEAAGAAQPRGPHLCTPPDGSKMHEQPNVARGTARSKRREQQRPARPRATGAQKTWGSADGLATRRCRRRIGRTVCEFGTRRGQLWKLRRNSAARAASLHGARRERDARATLCGKARGELTASSGAARREAAGGGCEEDVGQGGRPGSKALPAENRENGSGIWHAARAALEATAWRNSAGRMLARRKTGTIITSNAMCKAHGDITASCA